MTIEVSKNILLKNIILNIQVNHKKAKQEA